MDALSALVEAIDVGGVVHCRIEARSPWGMSAEPQNVASFHVLRRGRAFLRVDGEPDPLALEAGHVVVVPHGTSHAIVDRPGTHAVPFLDELRARGLDAAGIMRVGSGHGAATSIVCGAFVGRAERPPVLSRLPRVLLVRGHGRPGDALASTLVAIEAEMGAQQPGAGAVVTRLVGILFVQVLRAWIEQQPEQQRALLGSMTDPAIARALALIDHDPARAWSVAELARRCGMSRSAFAGRFVELVGEAPIQYVTRVRLQRAAIALRSNAVGVSEVARSVGYDSDAAFSRAFKRQFGAAPVEYRRALPSAASELQR
ncbi:MAG: AraC family transcriptional regulator [Nannocystaceae bacterium]|nr:AraC family transcriptional regulator [Nannocystaceae bacterium]